METLNYVPTVKLVGLYSATGISNSVLVAEFLINFLLLLTEPMCRIVFPELLNEVRPSTSNRGLAIRSMAGAVVNIGTPQEAPARSPAGRDGRRVFC
jgi:hypothetical protein